MSYRKSLSAQALPNRTSTALYTEPTAPRPSSFNSLYLPSTTRDSPGATSEPAGRDSEASGSLAPETSRPPSRSEERRVGKECRSRWSPGPEKKKKGRGDEARQA